jgi:Subtilase family/Bacterial Ig domain
MLVFGAGNDGPAPNTSMSPANNAGVLSVGALNADRSVAERSSRGPSGCGGGAFPSLYAPGVNLPALDRIAAATGSAALADGTSFATAAVSGALAVLRSANPTASRAEIEALLLATAQRGATDVSAAPTAKQALAQDLNWPSLGAALAAAKVPGAAAAPPAVLRWSRSVEPGKPAQISPDSLRGVLPWSAKVSSIRPAALPATGRLESQSGLFARLFGRSTEWSYEPDAAHPLPVRFEVETSEGPTLIVEFVPQAPAAATAQSRPRQSVQTAVNRSVHVPLSAELLQAPVDALRLTPPRRGGKVKRLADGQVEYTPPVNFVGTDQFTYSVRTAANEDATTIVVVQVVRQ